MQYGDLATWVTAIATCVSGIATIALFIVGFLQIRTERELRLAREGRAAGEARRDQAEQVSVWLMNNMSYDAESEMGYRWIAVLNQSRQPVYNAIINMVPLSQDGGKLVDVRDYKVCVALIPPGQGYVAAEEPGLGRAGNSRIGVEIGFQDKAGHNWLRNVTGELVEIAASPMEHFQIDLPTSWIGLQPHLPLDSYPPT